MVSFTTVITALALVYTTIAAPAEKVDALAAKTGSITYFHPALGACGQYNGDTDLVAALGTSRFDRERPCGRKLRVSYQGRSVDVKVVDRCTACADNDVDLSPTAFQKVIGPLAVGRVTATWDYI